MAKIFGNSTGLVQRAFGVPMEVELLGYSGVDIPVEYLVTVEDKRPEVYASNAGVKQTVMITAPLQEQITTRTEAVYQPLTSVSFLASWSGLAQLLTGRTLISRYASRQIWSGTSPLDFTLNLKFEAINDVYKEVLYPIIELQRMSLPFSGHKHEAEQKTLGGFFAESFLAPPSPDPFIIAGVNLRGKLPWVKNPEGVFENITVRIGTLLELKKVVVKDIHIQLQPKFSREGVPVEAMATVHFQTFEIVTKESLDNIYSGARKAITDERESLDNTPSCKGGPLSVCPTSF